ncbi:jg1017 [Pararge aegeria aegeria]|uniref:Jg1017 protein n=1 Tax=Pararge aegeria aegeria TaxID=348720 RepID=A0A8S4SH46_9NEOP|nr:jg1017 [Pararge aegeria aegeria]
MVEFADNIKWSKGEKERESNAGPPIQIHSTHRCANEVVDRDRRLKYGCFEVGWKLLSSLGASSLNVYRDL